MKIMVGSKNPAKVEAVKKAFHGRIRDFIVESAETESGVSDQPYSDQETIDGALNRARHALMAGDAELGIGLEGGVVETKLGLCLCNWGALAEKEQKPLIAGGARILLPDEIAEQLRKGKELGPVMEEYSKQKDVRKKEGAVGIFTNGLVTRDEMFKHVMDLLLGQYLYRKKLD